MAFKRTTATDPTHTGEVYILHGFMRRKEQFFDLAEHLSSWGVTSTVVDSRAARINEADHCSFEFPSDVLCTVLCERPKSTFTDSQIRSTSIKLSTAWILGRLDSEFDDNPWWNVSGERTEEFNTSGAITPL